MWHYTRSGACYGLRLKIYYILITFEYYLNKDQEQLSNDLHKSRILSSIATTREKLLRSFSLGLDGKVAEFLIKKILGICTKEDVT